MPSSFPLIHCYSDQTALAALGYESFAISCFDHWLSEEEASDALMCFPRGASTGERKLYATIEARFWRMHHELSCGPVFRVVSKGRLVRVDPFSRIFTDLWRSSRREFRLRGRFLDLYYAAPRVRLIQNWDLTDWAFVRDHNAAMLVENAARDAGLNVLR